MKKQHNVVKGILNRANGVYWEAIIDAACEYYSRIGIAEIEKTPEPMRPIGSPNGKGQFLACFTKKGQPDYKGTIKGGKAVVFEAKHTDTNRMHQSVITDEQEKRLNNHFSLGADCFVLVSFGLIRYYKIPWDVFRSMKEHYGRKYITPDDIQEYEITRTKTGGYLNFL